MPRAAPARTAGLAVPGSSSGSPSPWPPRFAASLARSLRALSGARTTNFFGLGRPARSPRPPRFCSTGRSAGGGEPRQGAEQRASRRLLHHPWSCGPVLPALRPAGRSAGAPRLALRRRLSGAGALPQLDLAGLGSRTLRFALAPPGAPERGGGGGAGSGRAPPLLAQAPSAR